MTVSRPTIKHREWESCIRPYAWRDREAVYRLAAGTAFFGDPVEAFLEDRALFCGAFVAYYVHCEPERLWVADIDGDVVGYVLGCADSQRRMSIVCSRVLPDVLFDLLRGRYRVGRKTLRLVLRCLVDWLEHPSLSVCLARFPGHLHINVAAPVENRVYGIERG